MLARDRGSGGTEVLSMRATSSAVEREAEDVEVRGDAPGSLDFGITTNAVLDVPAHDDLVPS